MSSLLTLALLVSIRKTRSLNLVLEAHCTWRQNFVLRRNMTSVSMSGQLELLPTSFSQECLLSLVKVKRKFTLRFNILNQALRKRFGNRFPKMQLISSKSALTKTTIRDQKFQNYSNIHGSKKWSKRSKSATIYNLKSELILQTSQRPLRSSPE